jgi:hypothetical protein
MKSITLCHGAKLEGLTPGIRMEVNDSVAKAWCQADPPIARFDDVEEAAAVEPEAEPSPISPGPKSKSKAKPT